MDFDAMDAIFELAASTSLISLLFTSNCRFYKHLRTLVLGLHVIDMIFKLVTLDDLDDASNLNQSIGCD